MGALVTKALRPIKNFNVENRAHRLISKEKPEPAPKYPSNIEDLKRTLRENPDIEDKISSKDIELDERLKDVYVTSAGRPEVDITREKINPERPLPQTRTMPADYEYGFKEPDRIPYGKTTLRHTITFLSSHQADPENITAERIALEYKMKEEDVKTILKYFKTFEVYVPSSKEQPARFAGPATLRNVGRTDVEVKEAERLASDDKKRVLGGHKQVQ